MEYIEKNFPQPAPVLQNTSDATMQTNPMTYEATKHHMENNLFSMRKMMGGVSKDITKQQIIIFDKLIDGYKDKIRLRFYQPLAHKKSGALLYIHGGAWFGGSIYAVEEFCKTIADRGNMVVISVEYHLAPEFPFPTAIEDCYHALQWVWDHSETLHIEKSDITVGGDSAGGNISAVLCLMAKDRGTISIKNQVLLYPAVTFEDDMIASPEMNVGKKEHLEMQVIREWYLGTEKNYAHPYASPYCATDLSHLPDALIVICQQDGLQFQGKAYGLRLSEAGNRVRCLFYLNTPHAFIDDTGTQPQAEDVINEIVHFIFEQGNHNLF